MKCIVYSLLLIFVLNAPEVSAQGKFLYGVSSGSSLVSTVNINSRTDHSSSFSGPGVALECGIEIGYFDWDHLSYSAKVLFDASAGFLEIPVLVKYPLTQGQWKGYAFGGPIMGLLLNQDWYKTSFPLDIGIYAGAGCTRHLESGMDLFIEAGYSFGLINLSSPSLFGNAPVYSREHSLAFHFYLGILFGS